MNNRLCTKYDLIDAQIEALQFVLDIDANRQVLSCDSEDLEVVYAAMIGTISGLVTWMARQREQVYRHPLHKAVLMAKSKTHVP